MEKLFFLCFAIKCSITLSTFCSITNAGVGWVLGAL